MGGEGIHEMTEKNAPKTTTKTAPKRAAKPKPTDARPCKGYPAQGQQPHMATAADFPKYAPSPDGLFRVCRKCSAEGRKVKMAKAGLTPKPKAPKTPKPKAQKATPAKAPTTPRTHRKPNPEPEPRPRVSASNGTPVPMVAKA